MHYGISGRKLRSEYVFGPLWAVGCRCAYKNDVEEVLRLFLERGENINSQCGPSGTLLHAVARVVSRGLLDKWNMHTCFRMCLAHGANSNATGPYGNVLEYTWRKAHGRARPHSPFWRSCGPLIRVLIDLGIPNSVCDPNGQIPSRERMLAVAARNLPNAEDMSIYYHGTPTRSDEWREGRYGCFKRRFPMEPRQGDDDDDEDSSSVYSTASRSDWDSEDASEGASQDEGDSDVEKG